MVFNTGPYTVLPDNSILNTANLQSETGFPSSHQLKSYVASRSHLKLAARAVLSADAGLLVCFHTLCCFLCCIFVMPCVTVYRLVFVCAEKKYNETSEKYRELQSRYFSKSEYWVSFLGGTSCLQHSTVCFRSVIELLLCCETFVGLYYHLTKCKFDHFHIIRHP